MSLHFSCNAIVVILTHLLTWHSRGSALKFILFALYFDVYYRVKNFPQGRVICRCEPPVLEKLSRSALRDMRGSWERKVCRSRRKSLASTDEFRSRGTSFWMKESARKFSDILGAFIKRLLASSCPPVRPSVCTRVTIRLQVDRFR